MYGLLSDSRYAYRPRALDDALSADIFKRYLEALDGGKLFFTAQDVAKFAPYKTTLDDAIKSGDLEPAYAIFAIYKQRVDERSAYARNLLKQDIFDFSGNDRWYYDREKTRRGPPTAPRSTRCGSKSRPQRLAAPEARRQEARRHPQDARQALRDAGLVASPSSTARTCSRAS